MQRLVCRIPALAPLLLVVMANTGCTKAVKRARDLSRGTLQSAAACGHPCKVCQLNEIQVQGLRLCPVQHQQLP
jgi:hypothetical protein